MRRLTTTERRALAHRPEDIPHDTQCDKCERRAVARGTDGERAFALCADDYVAQTESRRAGPKVDAATRAAAIQAAVSA